MKHILLIFSLAIACGVSHSTTAEASGCLGGEWREVSRTVVGTKKLEPSYPGSTGGMSATVYRGSAIVIFENVKPLGEPDSNELEFRSDKFDPDEVHVPDVFRMLESLPKNPEVKVIETVQTNPYYDDCEDTPADTLRTTTTYEFSLTMLSKKVIHFSAFGGTVDTPPKE